MVKMSKLWGKFTTTKNINVFDKKCQLLQVQMNCSNISLNFSGSNVLKGLLFVHASAFNAKTVEAKKSLKKKIQLINKDWVHLLLLNRNFHIV